MYFRLVLALLIMSLPTFVRAETKTITAEAIYTMGDGETPSFAEAQVLQRAKQIALEQAGTYVESYTKVQNLNLTTEEIQTIAGGVMTIEVLDKSRTLIGDGLKLTIKIRATVTTDKMEELARRIKGKNVGEEYKKLQEEYARLSREVESWKMLAAKTPQGAEREAALDQIREREQAFARTQRNETAFFERLVSGQVLVTEAKDAKSQIDDLIEIIKKDGHVIELGKVMAYEEKSSIKWFPWGNWPLSSSDVTLTVPVTIRVSPRLLELLPETIRSLSGSSFQVNHQGSFSGREREMEVKYYVRDGLGSAYGDYNYRGQGISFRPSSNRHLDQYFYMKLGTIMLVMDFYSPGERTESCTVSRIVNRVLPARNWLSTHFEVDLRSEQYRMGNPDSTILLLGEAKFSVELKLKKEWAEQVDRVSARFEGKSDSPREDVYRDKCQIADFH